jgi:hypothetical protein
LTALELADRRSLAVTAPASGTDTIATSTAMGREDESEETPVPSDQADTAPLLAIADATPKTVMAPSFSPVVPDQPLGAAQVHSALFQEPVPETSPIPVPEAMRRVQKCASCGFPVSEGRTLCVDCENKRHLQPESVEAAPDEPVPAFLASSKPPSESWLANHVNVLAVIVLILSIVVAVVVFR